MGREGRRVKGGEGGKGEWWGGKKGEGRVKEGWGGKMGEDPGREATY